MKKIIAAATVAALFVLVLVTPVFAETHFGDGGIYTDSATPVDTVIFTPQDGASYILFMSVIARQENGTGREAFKMTALVTRDAGTTTAVAVGAQEKIGNSSAWNFTAAIVNNAIVARGTGVAGAIIDWNVSLDGFIVGPYQ